MKHISLEIILKMKLFGGNFCFKEIILTQNSKIEKLVLPAAGTLKELSPLRIIVGWSLGKPTKNASGLDFQMGCVAH